VEECRYGRGVLTSPGLGAVDSVRGPGGAELVVLGHLEVGDFFGVKR